MARMQSFRAPGCPAIDPGSAWGERESGSADCREGDWTRRLFLCAAGCATRKILPAIDLIMTSSGHIVEAVRTSSFRRIMAGEVR